MSFELDDVSGADGGKVRNFELIKLMNYLPELIAHLRATAHAAISSVV